MLVAPYDYQKQSKLFADFWRIWLPMSILLAGLMLVTVGKAMAGPGLVMSASRYVGTNPTGWSHNWCGRFVDMVLRQNGYPSGGNLAIGYASYGRPCAARKGALAVMNGHIGFVVSATSNSVRIISGNHSGRSGSRKVGYGDYRMSRVVAFRCP